MTGIGFKGTEKDLENAFGMLSSYLGVKIDRSQEGVVFIGPEEKAPSSRAVIILPGLDKNYVSKVHSWFKWKGIKVPVLSKPKVLKKNTVLLSDLDNKPLISLTRSGSQLIVEVGFDILDPILYHLSGKEEMECEKKDQFGRFEHSSSFLHREGLMCVPIVTVYLDVIGMVLQRVFSSLEIPFVRIWPWPHNKRYALGLSHDTDEIKRWTLKKSAHNLIKGNVKTSMIALKGASSSLEDNEFWTFEEIIQLEKEMGVSSTFFMSGLSSRIKNSRPAGERRYYELAYDTEPAPIKELYRSIEKAGWEMGLHSGFSVNNDPKRLSEERKNISKVSGKDVKGVRQHFLKFTLPDFATATSKAGFGYDSSIGFSTVKGFRAGACHPYYLFDLNKKKNTDVLEFPLALMECTLSSKTKIAADKGLKEAWKVLGPVRDMNGCISVLWHTNRFLEDEFPGWSGVYVGLMEKAQLENALLTSLGELETWCRARDRVVIERTADNMAELSCRDPIEGLTLVVCGAKEGIKAKGAQIIENGDDGARLVYKKIEPGKRYKIELF